jgi:CheY-like chemotaxis protein
VCGPGTVGRTIRAGRCDVPRHGEATPWHALGSEPTAMNMYRAATTGSALLVVSLAAKRARELGAALRVSEETCISPADPTPYTAAQAVERQTQQAPKMEFGVPVAPLRLVDGCATVLIVEDDPRVRRLVEIVLRRAGHDVVSVAGPRDALAALNSQSDFNLVLTDVVMPEMSGYDLAAEVRKIVPRARLVFMSGFACDAVRQPVTDPFLAKPFTIESLTNAVQQALTGAG